jgi:hypothetical protein
VAQLKATEQRGSVSAGVTAAGPRLQIVSDLHLEFQKDLGRGLLEKRLLVANPYGNPNEVNPGVRPLVLEGGAL